MHVLRTVVATLLVVTVVGCEKAHRTASRREELLIYCGITMIHPMREIADIIEEERGCVIKISKGGSGNLLDAIRFNQEGDLFLPGSESYIETGRAEGLITETQFVGYNVAAIVVPEGNPRGIPHDPAFLTNKSCIVILANSASGSIGREAKAVLTRRGVADAVFDNGPVLTTDSKDITRAIREGAVDVGINWYATTLWEENSADVEGLLMDEEIAPPRRLVLGRLRTSRFPDAARRFMEYAASPQGRAIFKRYGFFLPGDPSEGAVIDL